MMRAMGAVLLGLALVLGAMGPATAEEPIYGSQLMTEQEKHEYMARLRQARTPVERQRVMIEHHERMKIRAKAKGITLPAPPPNQPGAPMRQHRSGGHY